MPFTMRMDDYGKLVLEDFQRWKDQQIRNPYTPTPSASSATSSPAAADASTPVPKGGDLHAYARQAAQRAGIDPDQFERQIQQESGFNPKAGSPAGAQGIAQIVPKYHPGVDTSDPYASLDYASTLMADYKAKYKDDAKALAAYNAGAGAVDQYGGVPPFLETQTYVSNILQGAKQAVGDAASSVGAAVRQKVNDISQFGDSALTTAEAYAACGPAAAVRFASMAGRNPTLSEALQLAKASGWTEQGGMAGLGSQKSLMDKLGIDTKLVTDTQSLIADATSGNPVIISTPGHYFFADNYDPSKGFHVGQSGLDLKGGSDWMGLDAIQAKMGQVQGGLLANSPLTQAPSAAASPTAAAGGAGGITGPDAVKAFDSWKSAFTDKFGQTAGGVGQAVGNAIVGPSAASQTTPLQRLGAGITAKGQEIGAGDQIPGAPGASNVIGGGLQALGGMLSAPPVDQQTPAQMVIGMALGPGGDISGPGLARGAGRTTTAQADLNRIMASAGVTSVRDLQPQHIAQLPGMAGATQGGDGLVEAIRIGRPFSRAYQEYGSTLQELVGAENLPEAMTAWGHTASSAGTGAGGGATVTLMRGLRQAEKEGLVTDANVQNARDLLAQSTGIRDFGNRGVAENPIMQRMQQVAGEDRAFLMAEQIGKQMKALLTGELQQVGFKEPSFVQNTMIGAKLANDPTAVSNAVTVDRQMGRSLMPYDNVMRIMRGMKTRSAQDWYASMKSLITAAGHDQGMTPMEAQASGWEPLRMLLGDGAIEKNARKAGGVQDITDAVNSGRMTVGSGLREAEQRGFFQQQLDAAQSWMQASGKPITTQEMYTSPFFQRAMTNAQAAGIDLKQPLRPGTFETPSLTSSSPSNWWSDYGQVSPRFATTIGGGAAGGVTGYATTPEGASPEERAARTIGGAAIGAGLGYGAGTMMTPEEIAYASTRRPVYDRYGVEVGFEPPFAKSQPGELPNANRARAIGADVGAVPEMTPGAGTTARQTRLGMNDPYQGGEPPVEPNQQFTRNPQGDIIPLDYQPASVTNQGLSRAATANLERRLLNRGEPPPPPTPAAPTSLLSKLREDAGPLQPELPGMPAAANPADWADKFSQVRTASLLSSPTTHGGNIASQVGTLGYKPLQELVAGHPGDAAKRVAGMAGATPSATRQFLSDVINGAAATQQGPHYYQHTRPFGDTRLQRALEIPTDVLQATDNWFQNLAAAGEMAVSGDKQAANTLAQRVTFHEPSDFADAFGDFRGSLPPQGKAVASALMPFYRVPWNILKRGVGLTAEPVTGIYKMGKDIKAGDMNALRGDAADWLIASVVTAGLATKAANGELSGDGPVNAGERAMLDAQGWQANSIKIGDRWIPYYWAGPLAIQMSVIANSFEAAHDFKAGAPADQQVLASVGRIKDVLAQSTFLRGAIDLFASDSTSQAASGVASFLTSFVPFSGALNFAASATDPTQRQASPGNTAEAVLGRAAQRLPGLRETQPAAPAILGGTQPNLNAGWSPLRSSVAKPDPTLQTLGQYGVTLPQLEDKLRVADTDIPLTDAQRQHFADVRGQLIRQQVPRVVSNPRFRAASPEMQHEILADVVNNIQDTARQQMLKEIGTPAVRAAVTANATTFKAPPRALRAA